MRLMWGLTGAALALGATTAFAADPASLASHRAGYEISLGSLNSEQRVSADAPIAASGLIAYEFRGSACEGYASNFRQLTELQRAEGGAVASDISAVSFEDGEAKSLRFEISTQTAGSPQPSVSGSAAREDDGKIDVNLVKPGKEKVDLGSDILFPTQHIERIIATARAGGRVLEARVFDGSDTGKKVYSTLAIIGLEHKGASPDSEVAAKLADVPRWPVTVSYFNETSKDSAPDYTMSFDLYENGVSGSLKLDYGTFALTAKLKKLDWLPDSACTR
ncbi:MAG: cell envelope integrity EipB family protein [Pseudomonadota bacterium]|nr:cell envelope integrity EipB family protein [Pseudomonadota bacterium]